MTQENFEPTVVSISGADRQRWLHSFVTNEIRDLEVGHLRETFATDLKGRTFGHGCVLVGHDQLHFVSLRSDVGGRLVEHWDRYVIREDVQLADTTDRWQWRLVDASEVPQFIEAAGGPGEHVLNLHRFALPAQQALIAVAQDHPVPGNTPQRSQVARLAAANRFPWFGIDFDESNLPQEIARDASAISFKKGCYLGQETVARLDALGQVQKRLFAVIAPHAQGAMPSAFPTDLMSEGQPAGQLTSLYATETDAAIGFAMVKRKHFLQHAALRTVEGLEVFLQHDPLAPA